MTVSELIERLNVCEPEADIYIYTGDVNLTELSEVDQSAPSVIIVS